MVFWASIYKRVTHVTSHKLEISSERKRSRVTLVAMVTQAKHTKQSIQQSTEKLKTHA